ncbi:hypothetical protein CVAR21S_02032 [Corynebacterium variabile]
MSSARYCCQRTARIIQSSSATGMMTSNAIRTLPHHTAGMRRLPVNRFHSGSMTSRHQRFQLSSRNSPMRCPVAADSPEAMPWYSQVRGTSDGVRDSAKAMPPRQPPDIGRQRAAQAEESRDP